MPKDLIDESAVDQKTGSAAAKIRSRRSTRIINHPTAQMTLHSVPDTLSAIYDY